MTERERNNLGVVANDVKWIRAQLEADCTRISKLEKIVYVGLGICIMGEVWLGWIR